MAYALLGAAVVGCGGGGGGSGGTGPVISNLSYDPRVVYVNSGGGQVTVFGSFSFANASGGVSSVTIDVVDSGGTTVSTSATPVASNPSFTSGTIQGQVIAATSIVGAYTIRVTLKDGAGGVSNALSGNFRIASQPWIAKAPMPHARQFFAAATSGGLAYVMGGELLGTGTTPGPDSSLVDVYDPAIDSWTTGIQLPTARKAPVAATVNGVIYVIGGSSLSAPGGLSTVEAFDPSTMQWTAMTAMPTPRSGAAAAVINGQICVFGGKSFGADLATTECFDSMSNSWSAQPPMPTARHMLGSDALGAYAYALGGYDVMNSTSIGGYLTTVERFDIANQTWSSIASMPTPRESAGVVTASGLLFAIGGGNAFARTLEAVEAYDPTTGNWTTKTAMPVPLVRVGALAIGGLVYVFEQGHTFQYTPGDDIL